MSILLTVIIAALSFLGTYCYRADSGLIGFLGIICLFVQVYLIVILMIKTEGVKKIIPIPVAVLTWIIAFLIFPGKEDISLIKDIFGFLKTALYWLIAIPVSLFIIYAWMGGGSGKASHEDEDTDASPEPSFGERMPNTLIDEDGNYWEKYYVAPNLASYSCRNANLPRVDLIEGATQYYNSGHITGSDGRTYHAG